MHINIQNGINDDVVATFTIYVEPYDVKESKEYVIFDKETKTLAISNTEESLEIREKEIRFKTNRVYNVEVRRMQFTPRKKLPNFLSESWRNIIFEATRDMLIEDRILFNFACFAGFGEVYIEIRCEKVKRDILIYAPQQNKVFIDDKEM